jgi:uncharacterized protein (DUF952 family)
MSIFHIAHETDWRHAREAGEYVVSSRGATLEQVGFIHASTAAQLDRTAEKFYADDPEPLVVLVIDDAAIEQSGTPLRYEDGGDGDLFPHIYGPIDPTWVIEAVPASFDNGRFSYRPR